VQLARRKPVLVKLLTDECPKDVWLIRQQAIEPLKYGELHDIFFWYALQMLKGEHQRL